MNIRNVLKKISFGCGLATLCCTLQASAFCADNCCPTTCCEDGPLNCNSFGVQIKGGVTPTWFGDRDHLTIINPSLSDPIVRGARSPEFDKFFDMPWQVGAELQWNASTHVQFFAEYVFESAKGKKHNFLLSPEFSLHHKFRDFETNAAYIGARYYFSNVWCSECGTSSIAPFFGFKAGAVWHEKTRFRSRFVTVAQELDLGNIDGFKRQTLFSAGVQLGLDWSINCNWGVVLTVEAVGTQGLRSSRIVPLVFETPVLGAPTAVSFGDPGHFVSVPVTLGVRYTF